MDPLRNKGADTALAKLLITPFEEMSEQEREKVRVAASTPSTNEEIAAGIRQTERMNELTEQLHTDLAGGRPAPQSAETIQRITGFDATAARAQIRNATGALTAAADFFRSKSNLVAGSEYTGPKADAKDVRQAAGKARRAAAALETVASSQDILRSASGGALGEEVLGLKKAYARLLDGLQSQHYRISLISSGHAQIELEAPGGLFAQAAGWLEEKRAPLGREAKSLLASMENVLVHGDALISLPSAPQKTDEGGRALATTVDELFRFGGHSGADRDGLQSSLEYHRLGGALADVLSKWDLRSVHRAEAEVAVRALGPNHPDAGLALLSFGDRLEAGGDPYLAAGAFARAGEIFARVFGDQHPLVELAAGKLTDVDNKQPPRPTPTELVDDAIAQAKAQPSLLSATRDDVPESFEGWLRDADNFGQMFGRKKLGDLMPADPSLTPPQSIELAQLATLPDRLRAIQTGADLDPALFNDLVGAGVRLGSGGGLGPELKEKIYTELTALSERDDSKNAVIGEALGRGREIWEHLLASA